eukprot:4277865-Amphidinium_carterae.1
MSSSMHSNPSVPVVNYREMAEIKAQKGREKRARQAARRAAVSMNKVAVMGSSDSDGFIQIDIEDNLSTSSKSRDEEIKGLEKKLALLRATRKDKTCSSTDSEPSTTKVRKETIEETGFSLTMRSRSLSQMRS